VFVAELNLCLQHLGIKPLHRSGSGQWVGYDSMIGRYRGKGWQRFLQTKWSKKVYSWNDGIVFSHHDVRKRGDDKCITNHMTWKYRAEIVWWPLVEKMGPWRVLETTQLEKEMINMFYHPHRWQLQSMPKRWKPSLLYIMYWKAEVITIMHLIPYKKSQHTITM
jgi:hypothetical protein